MKPVKLNKHVSFRHERIANFTVCNALLQYMDERRKSN